MSSKQKILPRLRFPEFENGENLNNYTRYKFSDIFLFSTGKNIKQSEASPEFKTPCVRYGELYHLYGEVIKSIINKTDLDSSELKFSKGNEILIPSAGEDPLDIGSASALTIKNVAIGRTINILSPIKKNVYNQIYVSYYINEKFRRKISTLAKGSSISNVYNSDLKKLELTLPSLSEQQKIAACLSSLDEVITAETEKLDLLQDHKKGLLQQLFPQPSALGLDRLQDDRIKKGNKKILKSSNPKNLNSDKVPRFRFPEFEEDGEWEETTLDEVADYENGKAHEQEISDTGKYKVVNSKFISTEGQVVKFTDSANLMANTGDILMVLSDIPNGRAIAKCFYVDEDNTYTVNQRICKITPTDIDNKFLFYIQNRNKYFLAFDDGVKQTNLRKDTVLAFPFLTPPNPKEQQKIAQCLSAADALIEAQTQKIEALQEHKKGLLQGLFPSVND